MCSRPLLRYSTKAVGTTSRFVTPRHAPVSAEAPSISGSRERTRSGLQIARFRADTATVKAWSDDLAAIEVVHRLVSIIAMNHFDLGRHRFEFVRSLKGRVPDYAVDLASAQQELSSAVAARVESINGHAGPPPNQAARLSWLWAVSKGVGDHMIDDRFELMGVARDEFLDTTAECVLAGLRAPSPVTVDGALDEGAVRGERQ